MTAAGAGPTWPYLSHTFAALSHGGERQDTVVEPQGKKSSRDILKVGSLLDKHRMHPLQPGVPGHSSLGPNH